MPSSIDSSFPTDAGPVSKATARANWSAAKTEINHGGFYSQLGAGAVNRQTQAKLREIGVFVTEFGAIGDGVTDDTKAFDQALDAVPTNGTVFVPEAAGTGRYRITGTVHLTNRRLVGVGFPWLQHEPADDNTDLVVLWNEYNDASNLFGSQVHNLKLVRTGSFGRDLISVSAGDYVRLSNLQIEGAKRNGVHFEPRYSNHWIENLSVLDVKVMSSARDNWHFRVPPALTSVFINQTRLINCESRYPGRYAVALVNDSEIGGGNAKLSAWHWDGGEIGGDGATLANDVVLLQTTSNGALESLGFAYVAIEDTTGAHNGYAIRVDKQTAGKIGPLTLNDVIYYGVAGGLITGAESLSGYFRNTVANGDDLTINPGSRVQVYRPYIRKGWQEEVVSPAISAGSLTLDVSAGNVFQVVLDQNVSAISISNPPPGGRAVAITIILTQPSSGATYTVSGWPASVTWGDQTAPTMPMGLSNAMVVTLLTVDGGTKWRATQGWRGL